MRTKISKIRCATEFGGDGVRHPDMGRCRLEIEARWCTPHWYAEADCRIRIAEIEF